jgi:subtilase family serine protease
MNALYQQNKVGQGRTIGIVTLAALDPGAPEYFWQHYLHLYSNHDRVTVKNIDGGPGAPDDASGTGETDLDVDQSGGVAPGANVVVYQAPNTDNGFVDAFFAAASENVADSVSASWGSSETFLQASINSGFESPGYAAAFDEAFLELAAQGQSTFVASGDAGAYDASVDLGSTNLSIDTPSDSPYVTAAGGTTLPWSATLGIPSLLDNSANINVTSERAWGWDYLASALSSANPSSSVDPATLFELLLTGGGGGYSAFEPQPSYQSGVSGISTYTSVPYLTPTTFISAYGLYLPTDWNFNPAPTPSTHRAPSTRATPDLSANADPLTGYLVYEPSALTAAVPLPALQGGYGGTSFVAPQFAGATAVLASAVGHRVGLWNPALYALARGSHSPLTPLSSASTSNDNLFYTGTPGTLYNPATGLGIPNFSLLATDYTRYWFTN